MLHHGPTAVLHQSSIVEDRPISGYGEPITKDRPIIKDGLMFKNKPTNGKPITEGEDKV